MSSFLGCCKYSIIVDKLKTFVVPNYNDYYFDEKYDFDSENRKMQLERAIKIVGHGVLLRDCNVFLWKKSLSFKH